MINLKVKSKPKSSRQIKNQAVSEEKISDLKNRLLDITKNYDYKLTKQAYTKLTKDITGASRLIKLQNIESEYVEALRGVKTDGKRVSLTIIREYKKEGGETEKHGVLRIQRAFRNRVNFKMVNQADIKSAMHGMVHQVKIQVRSLGRDINDNIPLILRTAYATAVRESKVKLTSNDKFYSKLRATISKKRRCPRARLRYWSF